MSVVMLMITALNYHQTLVLLMQWLVWSLKLLVMCQVLLRRRSISWMIMRMVMRMMAMVMCLKMMVQQQQPQDGNSLSRHSQKLLATTVVRDHQDQGLCPVIQKCCSNWDAVDHTQTDSCS